MYIYLLFFLKIFFLHKSLQSTESGSLCYIVAVHVCSVTQSCLTFSNPMGCSQPWDSPGKSTGVGHHFLLQELFLTQGLNLSLLRLFHLVGGFLTTEPPRKPIYSRSLLVIYFIYCSMYMSISIFQYIPLPTYSLVTIVYFI